MYHTFKEKASFSLGGISDICYRYPNAFVFIKEMYCKLPWTYLLESLGKSQRSWRVAFFFYLPASIIWPNWRWKVTGRFSILVKAAGDRPSDVFLRNYQVTFLCGWSLLIYLREHPRNSYTLWGKGFQERVLLHMEND